MSAIVRASPVVASNLQRNISSRNSFAAVPVAANKPRNVALRARSAVISASANQMSTVKILTQGRHLTVTPAIKEYVEQKVNKASTFNSQNRALVANFEGSVKEVDVKLSASGSHGKGSEAHHQRNQKVEVTVYTLRHGVIRVEDTEEDLYAAVDLVTDKLKRKMVRMKEKAVQRKTWPGRGGPRGADTMEAHIDPESSDEDLPTNATASAFAPEIVREKLLILENGSKMTPEEAVDQLEAVGHDFYVFLDAQDGAMKVVYRRRTNGYGLLIPQVQ